MTRSRRRAGFGALFVLWACVVWWLSSRPDPGASLGVSLEIPDWVAHGIEYAAGGFLAYGMFSGPTRLRSGMLAVVVCVLWGVLDEVHQSYVPGRDPDAFDVLADSVGAVLGTLAHVVLGSLRVRGVDDAAAVPQGPGNASGPGVEPEPESANETEPERARTP